MTTLGPSPGSRKYPEHKVQIAAASGLFTVEVNGQTVATSSRTLAVDESNYPRVIYFPREDVRTDRLRASSSRTTCPFKGDAHYFTAEIDGETVDVAWHYPDVYDEVASLAGHVAFYADRVEISHAETNSTPASD